MESIATNSKPALTNRINVSTRPPGPQSIALLQRMQKVIGRSSYCGLYGVTLHSGKGLYIEDADGNVYLDCLAAASSCSLGYGQDFLAQTYFDVVSQLQQSCVVYSPNVYAIELAEKLISIAPGDFDKKVMLGLSGSDAAEGAIKAMRRFTANQTIIHFKNDYHGSTGLSQDASDFGTLNEIILPIEPYFIEFAYPSTPDEANKVTAQIHQLLNQRKAGGILCEAIQGDAGVRIPPAGFMQGLRDVTLQTGSLLAIDEVQSGMGRTGKWWSFEHEGIVPDIFTTGKGLSGGYAPVSAVVGRREVIDALEPGQHIFTYGGHPASAAVACQVIDYMIQHDVLSNAAEVGEFLMLELRRTQKDYAGIIVAVRGRGLMIGVEINITAYLLAGRVFAARCMEKGIYVGFYGANAEVIRIEPPLVITLAEATRIIEIIREVAAEMQEGTIPAETYNNVHNYSLGI